MSPFCIDERLATYLESGNSMLVATVNGSNEPTATRICGLRVLAESRIALLLPLATSQATLANLRAGSRAAVYVSSPRTFSAAQVKGRAVAFGEPSAEDLAMRDRQFHNFAAQVQSFGFDAARARNLWLFECTRVDVEIDAAFSQSPGPGAGAPLEDSHGL